MRALALAPLLLIATAALAAPPTMRDSQPAAETLIRGRHTAYVVRFDTPVDHAASRLQLLQDGKVITELAPRLDSAPDVLYAAGETPRPGRYQLRWEVRSLNGESAEGVIPFSTAP
jgi:methionine-rich copper-binding protein CopC